MVEDSQALSLITIILPTSSSVDCLKEGVEERLVHTLEYSVLFPSWQIPEKQGSSFIFFIISIIIIILLWWISLAF